MFCPFRSATKIVECSKECALYTGSIDGKDPKCAFYSLSCDMELCRTRLKEIEKDLDEAARGLTILADKE